MFKDDNSIKVSCNSSNKKTAKAKKFLKFKIGPKEMIQIEWYKKKQQNVKKKKNQRQDKRQAKWASNMKAWKHWKADNISKIIDWVLKYDLLVRTC